MNEKEREEIQSITYELDDYIMCALSEINDSPSLVDASVRLHVFLEGGKTTYEEELEEWKDALGNEEYWENDKKRFLSLVNRDKKEIES